jgi:hypothetical protein
MFASDSLAVFSSRYRLCSSCHFLRTTNTTVIIVIAYTCAWTKERDDNNRGDRKRSPIVGRHACTCRLVDKHQHNFNAHKGNDDDDDDMRETSRRVLSKAKSKTYTNASSCGCSKLDDEAISCPSEGAGAAATDVLVENDSVADGSVCVVASGVPPSNKSSPVTSLPNETGAAECVVSDVGASNGSNSVIQSRFCARFCVDMCARCDPRARDTQNTAAIICSSFLVYFLTFCFIIAYVVNRILPQLCLVVDRRAWPIANAVEHRGAYKYLEVISCEFVCQCVVRGVAWKAFACLHFNTRRSRASLFVCRCAVRRKLKSRTKRRSCTKRSSPTCFDFCFAFVAGSTGERREIFVLRWLFCFHVLCRVQKFASVPPCVATVAA